MKMIIKFEELNDFKKVGKLLRHALALSSNKFEILLQYGEYLESRQEFIEADCLYSRVLLEDPENSRAISNRRRVLSVINVLDSEQLKRIDSKREDLVCLTQNNTTLEHLEKEIYFEHIHNTVAIEGSTMTLAETRNILENKMPISGKSMLEYNEILSMDAALCYLNQTSDNKKSITIPDILAIHKRVLGHVPSAAGTFRKVQVVVGEHYPPPAHAVAVLMDEFVEFLKSPRFKTMHPIHKAASAHFEFVDIHPFLDGNGRTARLLMNLFFKRHGYPATLIKNEEKYEYFSCLQLAHEGDIKPFYRFIAQCTEATLDLLLQAYIIQREKANCNGIN